MNDQDKRCGPRGGRGIWTKDELIREIRRRYPTLTSVEVRALKKRELCERLGIPYRERAGVVVPITDRKVCTNRRTRAYPNRYTREELVERAKRNRPSMSLGKLRLLKIRDLCRIARLAYHEVEPVNPLVPSPIIGGGASQQGGESSDLGSRTSSGGRAEHKQTAPDSCRNRGSKTLLDHQNGLLDRLQQHRGVIAVHATGSGKTLSAVVASQCFLDEHPRSRVIVLTPASLVSNIEKELTAFGQHLRHRDRYTILSYQTFLNRKKSRAFRHDPTLGCRGSMLIVDEAHNFRTEYKKKGKKYQGVMTEHVLECAEQARKVLLLTATPIINRLADIVPLLNMIRDDARNPNTRLDAKTFLEHSLDPVFLDRHLHGRFHFFQPRDDHGRDIYPAMTTEQVFLPMTPRYLEKYQEIETLNATEDNVYLFGDVNLKMFFNGVRRATNTLEKTTTTPTFSPKLRWILDFLQNHRPPQKTIVYSQFLDMGSLAIFRRLPPAIRDRVGFITGQVPRKTRQGIVDRYNHGDIDILFLSKAGGEGLDLKGTRHIIIVEPAWNISAEQQVIGRGVRFLSHAHLPFDERHVTVHRLLVIKPTDQEILPEILDKDLLRHPDGRLLSIDLMMHNLQKRKQSSIDEFLTILRAHV